MSKSGVIGDDECIRCRPTKDSGRSRGQPIFQEDPDVLIQHLDPSHHSLLAEILSKATKLPVGEVKSGIRIKPNHVYVIPPDAFMAITAATFKLTPRNKGSGQHLSVNFFMRSLAEERMSGAIGVILSGTGADATLGLERIKVEGGITFAQDPATAKYDGMPRSAIDSGYVDFVLPPKEIAKELQRIQRHPYIRQEERGAEEQRKELEDSVAPPPQEEAFAAILDQLRKASGIISRLGGSIRVRSSVRSAKSGTCFSIFLPTQLPGRA
jgi:two-component system CheB/CheR fusion protein